MTALGITRGARRQGQLMALDLFCGGGGATAGLQRAGFFVVGVDIKDQPRYPGDGFIRGDALMEHVDLSGFDFIWASPPCQAYTPLRKMWNAKTHADLIPQTRARLKKSGRPYVIENVPGAPLEEYFTLCGSMFGLCTASGAELRRHRIFETNFFVGLTPQCNHGLSTLGVYGGHVRDRCRTIQVTGDSPKGRARTIGIYGGGPRQELAPRFRADGKRKDCVITVTGRTPQQNVVKNRVRETFTVDDARAAMGIDWLPMTGLSQAIPPVYSGFIARAWLAQRRSEAA